MIEYFSSAIMPVLICIIVGYGVFKKTPVFDCFLEGAREGIKTTFRILPALTGLVVAVSMLRASGITDLLTDFLSPLLLQLHFPKEILPLALIRPVSGSGAMAVYTDILQNYGADSFAGKCASVIMGSTETTFYTIAVYFGSIGIKNIRYTLKAALLADLTGIIAGVFFVYILLF